MSGLAEALPVTPRGRDEARVVASISAAHFVSHYYILLLPPLFAFVRADYGVSYTELGLALTAFNVVTAALQTPAGFLVDRIGARLVLIAGLLLGVGAFAVVGLVHSFWVLVAMFAIAGLGNTAYHPADYAILSRHVAPARIGQAFSIHTFSGMLGSAVAPGTLLFMQSQFGWRGAFIGAAVLGLVAALVLILQRDTDPEASAPGDPDARPAVKATEWRLLLAPAILINLVFFMLIAVTNAGYGFYSVVALGALYGTDPVLANTALSAFLFLSAAGVLAGGLIVGRTERHALIAASGMGLGGVMALVVGLTSPGPVGLVVAMGVGGFAIGFIMPSRDMIVRAVTPPGAFGRVFGFITTGFNIGGMVAPLMFGLLMDHGDPRGVFVVIAASCAVAILTVALATWIGSAAGARQAA